MTSLALTAAVNATNILQPATSGATASAIGTNSLQQLGGNFQSFLSLLMTQMRNQDPTAPMDANQFTTELVQFTGVQQGVATNSNLSQLIALTQQNQVLQSGQLTGKTADVSASAISLQNSAGTIGFSLPTAQPVGIAIVDGTGRVVRQVSLAANAGSNVWHWDGRDDSGAALPDGAYRIAVESGTDSAPQPVTFDVLGTVTGMTQGANGLTLQLGGLSVPMSAVHAIGG